MNSSRLALGVTSARNQTQKRHFQGFKTLFIPRFIKKSKQEFLEFQQFSKDTKKFNESLAMETWFLTCVSNCPSSAVSYKELLSSAEKCVVGLAAKLCSKYDAELVKEFQSKGFKPEYRNFASYLLSRTVSILFPKEDLFSPPVDSPFTIMKIANEIIGHNLPLGSLYSTYMSPDYYTPPSIGYPQPDPGRACLFEVKKLTSAQAAFAQDMVGYENLLKSCVQKTLESAQEKNKAPSNSPEMGKNTRIFKLQLANLERKAGKAAQTLCLKYEGSEVLQTGDTMALKRFDIASEISIGNLSIASLCNGLDYASYRRDFTHRFDFGAMDFVKFNMPAISRLQGAEKFWKNYKQMRAEAKLVERTERSKETNLRLVKTGTYD